MMLLAYAFLSLERDRRDSSMGDRLPLLADIASEAPWETLIQEQMRNWERIETGLKR